MSSTRLATAGTPFRQERFCSSPEFERGLMGNLVARRCEQLEDADARDLIWWIQAQSHEAGGLAGFTAGLLARFPERIGTPSMLRIGTGPGRIYAADEVRAIRPELDNPEAFPLRHDTVSEVPMDWDLVQWTVDERARRQTVSDTAPTEYPASAFVQVCQDAAKEGLERHLGELCLDPDPAILQTQPWYFPGLLASLRELQAEAIATQRRGLVVTELGRQVWEAMDFALEGRCMVVIDGKARTGKTFAAKSWCELHPGRARYVQVPSSNDDIGFFRAIARALGVSINQNSKAQQLRDRVEDVLQRGGLMVVFDEAHYLWPQSNYRQALPARINWIMTALVNHQVPVALVTTPQFMRSQLALEQRTHWSGEQFTGRIGHYQRLPDTICDDDLEGVARFALPEGCARSIETLVVYAKISRKYLAGIETSVRLARARARKENRSVVTFDDIRFAIKDSVIPSDTALSQAIEEPSRCQRGRSLPAPQSASVQAPTPQPVTAAVPAGVASASKVATAPPSPLNAPEAPRWEMPS